MSLSLKTFLKTIGTKHASYIFKIEPILVKFGSPTVCFHPFINVSHIFSTSNCNFLMFKQGVFFHPRHAYPKVWLQSYSKESG